MSITHPSMRRAKLESPAPVGQKQEVYIVDNAAEEVPQSEVVSEPTPPQNPKMRNTLESLLFLGRLTERINLCGVEFEVSTLTQKENSELVKYLYNSNSGADLFAIRGVTLAYAIKSINNVSFEDYLGFDGKLNPEAMLDQKMAVVNGMQKHVVEKLHEVYLKLSESGDKLFVNDEAKVELKN